MGIRIRVSQILVQHPNHSTTLGLRARVPLSTCPLGLPSGLLLSLGRTEPTITSHILPGLLHPPPFIVLSPPAPSLLFLPLAPPPHLSWDAESGSGLLWRVDLGLPATCWKWGMLHCQAPPPATNQEQEEGSGYVAGDVESSLSVCTGSDVIMWAMSW